MDRKVVDGMFQDRTKIVLARTHHTQVSLPPRYLPVKPAARKIVMPTNRSCVRITIRNRRLCLSIGSRMQAG